MKIRPVGDQLFHADRRTDIQTDMTKLNFKFCWPCIMQCFLVNDQRGAQIPFYVFIFLFIAIYMFRAHRAHHQERQIVSIQPLLTVTLCW